MNSSNKLQIKILVELCAAYGLRKVVISPGSRNAPLIRAFHNHPKIECFVIPDERSAAYFALGIAQFTKQPVGLLCTSGTAALNYAPALAEAYHQYLPLFAITADRPPEWIGQQDGQTINQTGIYSNFTVYEAQLPVEVTSQHEIWHTERLIRDGFHALLNKNRPVHINVPLREPLYSEAEEADFLPECTQFDFAQPTSEPGAGWIKALENHSSIMLVFGMRRPDQTVRQYISNLAKQKKLVILSETLSNLAIEGVFQTSDALFAALKEPPHDMLKPDLVISFDDMLLSKPLKQWIRSLKNVEKWIVSTHEPVADVFQGVNRMIQSEAKPFIQQLTEIKNIGNQTFYEDWQNAYTQFNGFHNHFVASIPWSDMKVFGILSNTVPSQSIVHLGNSSPVRYAQFFRWNTEIQFFSNRGTSGIDGASSTAIGMASQADALVTLITGDVSFLYDSNALWNNYKKKNFRIIVINNKGGNIFSLIGGPQNTGLLNDYFKTHIPVSMEYLCKAYGIDYYKVTNEPELETTLDRFYQNNACALLEITTDPVANTKVWKDYLSQFRFSPKTI